MKKRPLWMKAFSLAIGLTATGVLMTACTKGYDDDPAFESSVKNSTLKALAADDIVVKSSADGSTFTFTWQVVHGAGGYEVKLFNVSDPDNAVLVKADTTDACTVTMPREDDVNYMVAVRALSNASLGNTEQAEATEKTFTTFTPTYGTISYDEYPDLKAYFDANPLPEGPTEMLCFDLEGGKEYTLSGDIDFGGHHVTIRCTNKNSHAGLKPAAGAKFVTFGSFYLKYLDVDCAETNKPIVELSETPDDSIKNLVGTSGYYFIQDPIVFQSCNIKNLGACLIQDQGKYVVRNMTINDCVIAIDRTAEATNAVAGDPIIKLTKASYVTDFVVKNSTIYSKEHTSSAFLTYNGRPKELNDASELQKISFVSTTLFNLSYSTNFRGDTRTQGQTSNYFTVEKCIIVDCGKKNFINSLIRQLSTNPTVSYYKNTYWWDGANVKESQVCDGGDRSGTALDTDPDFKDPANGDFTPQGADQINNATGDPRWLKAEVIY